MRRTSALLIGTILGLVAGCGSGSRSNDGGGGAGGGGIGGGGAAGQTGGGGQVDADSCRLEGQTCAGAQRCCGPLICAGVCSMGVLTPVDSGLAADASDARADAGPAICASLRALVFSNPTLVSGTVAAGQTVTVQLTLTDTDPNGYVSYPEALLSSPTPGVSFPATEAGPPGAYIDGTMAKPITFPVKLDASLPSGTLVQINARPVGMGHLADDCAATVLTFSLATT